MKWSFVSVAALAALSAIADESPLVHASKEAKKTKEKKTVVITNATLKQSKAKLSTTKSQRPIPKSRPNDCVVTPIATPPLAVATAAPKEEPKQDFPRARTPQMDDADVEYLLEELAQVPISKLPENVTSKPQFSANTSEPQTSQPKKP